MIRMEIACFLVIAFMSAIYFSVKREKTKLHMVFSLFLIVSMFHLAFDGLTVYTVNHLYSIPLWINDILHRLFMGTMMILLYLAYSYIVLLIEDDTNKKIKSSNFGKIVLGIAMVGTVFLPITYMETEDGNYSYGLLPYMLYAVLAVFLLLILSVLCRYWKKINAKKKNVISLAMAIELLAMLFQAFYPLALISGMGMMLVALSFYLTMENPDIALVQQVQKERQKADEANAAKSTFLSHMSHEIRTPMNAIVGMTDIMLRTDLTEEQREYLTNIKSSGNALVSLINDILDISKIEAGKMELVEDIYEIEPILNDIRMIIQNRIGDKPVKLFYEIDNLPDKLYGDGLRIRQIMINLLNNAVKFTEEGHVKLKIRKENQTVEGVMLFVSVSDTGQGIREEDLKKLFGAFEQVDTKKNKGKEGTGVGLAISSELIGMMGGKLEVKSTYGAGTEFFFRIFQKFVPADLETEEKVDENMNFTAPEAKILVVDDNEMNRKVAVGLLEPLQMQIDLADNGKKALVMIQEKKYHMIFMDHMMPIMDGVEATKCLRQMEDSYYKELPVIALTANAMKESKQMFEEAGMNGFVAKPIEMKQICRTIRKWLPANLIIEQEVAEENGISEDIKQPEEISIEGIDIKEGIKNSGTRELFVSLLGDFYKLIDTKSLKIEKCMDDALIRDYTIEVHALKNTARMIGAMKLSEQFWELEQLGNANDMEAIYQKTPKVLSLYRSYKTVLKSYGTAQAELKEVSKEEILLYLKGIQEAIEGFDLDAADAAMEKLEQCRLPEACQSLMEDLRVFVADVAMEEILKITEEMIKKIEVQ